MNTLRRCSKPLAVERWSRYVGGWASRDFNDAAFDDLILRHAHVEAVTDARCAGFPRCGRLSPNDCRIRNRLACGSRRRRHQAAEHQRDGRGLRQAAGRRCRQGRAASTSTGLGDMLDE